MTGPELLVTIISGLTVNECCDLSPALARAIVRWSARRHYRNPVRAAERAEELSAYINDRPGKLFKLIVAGRFAAAALVTRPELRGSTPTAPSLQPTQAAAVEFNPERDYVPYADRAVWQSRIDQMNEAWQALEHDVKVVTRPVSRRGDLQRRLCKLREATGDDRWDLISANIARLQHPARHFSARAYIQGTNLGQGGYAPGHETDVPTAIPAESTVTGYLAAAQRVRNDIQQLSAPFAQIR